jgi:spore coat polysaccharide biosynthesis protein SpsF
MGSSRLPGKVMMDICGKPVLQHIVERLQFSKKINKIIVLTSINPENKVILKLCKSLKISCFLGSEDNVLDRFYKAAKYYKLNNGDRIIRITADCPLTDPAVIDALITKFQQSLCDFGTNCLNRTFPDGLDVEIFRYPALKKSWEKSLNPYEHEHPDEYILRHQDDFEIFSMTYETDLSVHRWTLDTLEDFEFIKRIYEKLYQPGQIFYMEDVLKWPMSEKQN